MSVLERTSARGRCADDSQGESVVIVPLSRWAYRGWEFRTWCTIISCALFGVLVTAAITAAQTTPTATDPLASAIEDLVIADRILPHDRGINVDAYGHVTASDIPLIRIAI